MRLLIAVAVLMSMPTMAVAEDAAPAKPEKKTCRAQEAVGTMFTKRICHTTSEWAKIDERARSDAQNFDNDRRDKPGLPR